METISIPQARYEMANKKHFLWYIYPKHPLNKFENFYIKIQFTNLNKGSAPWEGHCVGCLALFPTN